MSVTKKCLCLLLAVLMAFCLFGCKKDEKNVKMNKEEAKAPVTEQDSVVDLTPYYGTWKGSDHDGEKVVHYLIFDENGYWNVYMNYVPLLKAIEQMPNMYVSFKVFREERQNSDHTGCYYRYIENTDAASYADLFTISEDGKLFAKDLEDVIFTFESSDCGEPSDKIAAEARGLFDQALIDAGA